MLCYFSIMTTQIQQIALNGYREFHPSSSTPATPKTELPSLAEMWKGHALNETKAAILLLIEEGLLTEELQAAFQLPIIPMQQEDFQELEQLLNHSFGTFTPKTLINHLHLPLTDIQIIGSSIPLSNAYLLRLLEFIPFKKEAAKAALRELIAQRSREWSDLDIRIKIPVTYPGQEFHFTTFINAYLAPHNPISKAQMRGQRGLFFCLSSPTAKIDLTFLWNRDCNPFQFSSDSTVVEILPYLIGGMPIPFSNSGSFADWFLHHILKITDLNQPAESIDRTFYPKYLCNTVKGNITRNHQLEKALYTHYFDCADTFMDQFHLLQRGRLTHLPTGANPTLAYWINCYECCQQMGSSLLDVFSSLLIHEKNLTGLAGEMIKSVQQKKENAPLIHAAFKCVSILTYFQSGKKEIPMSAAIIGEETCLQYSLDKTANVQFRLNMEKEVERLLAASDLSAVQFLFDKLPFTGREGRNLKLGFTPELCKRMAGNPPKGLFRLALLFLKVLAQLEPEKEYIDQVITILPEALLETTDRSMQKRILAEGALLLNPCLKNMEEWINSEKQTRSSCYRHLIQALIASGERCLAEKGVQTSRAVFEPEDLPAVYSSVMTAIHPKRACLLFREAMQHPKFAQDPLYAFSILQIFSPIQNDAIFTAAKTLFPKLPPVISPTQATHDLAYQVYESLLEEQQTADAEAVLERFGEEWPEKAYQSMAFAKGPRYLLAKKEKFEDPAFIEKMIVKSDLRTAVELFKEFPFLDLKSIVKALCSRGEEAQAKKLLLKLHESLPAAWHMILGSFYERENFEAASVAAREGGVTPNLMHQNLTRIFLEQENLRLAWYHLKELMKHAPEAEWRTMYHEWMDKKIEGAAKDLEKLLKQERFDQDLTTKVRWFKKMVQLIQTGNLSQAIELYPKARPLFTLVEMRDCIRRELVEKIITQDPVLLEKVIPLFPRKELFSMPEMNLAIELAAPRYAKIDELLELLMHLPDQTRFISGWNEVLLRLSDAPSRRADTLLIEWLEVANFGKVTAEEADHHLHTTRFWSLANAIECPLQQRQFVSLNVINLLRIVLRDTNPPKNQIPLIWYALAMQKNFDHLLQTNAPHILASFAAGERRLIETMGRIIDHEDFQEIARSRLNNLDLKGKFEIDERIRGHLKPTVTKACLFNCFLALVIVTEGWMMYNRLTRGKFPDT